MEFSIPERVGDMTGSAFAATIEHMAPSLARDLAIYQQFELGNVPAFMREPKKLEVTVADRVVELAVLPDVLCVGTNEDFLRIVLFPETLQKVADLFGASLITPTISDLIWKSADVVIDPTRVTMPPTVEMVTTKWFVEQNAKIEKERAGREGLIAGHKKDIVIANSLADYPHAVAIYGWHQRSGVPIQGLNPSRGIPANHVHDRHYVDYSHGCRLIAETVLVDGQPWSFSAVAQDATLCAAVNGKYGPLNVFRYLVEE